MAESAPLSDLSATAAVDAATGWVSKLMENDNLARSLGATWSVLAPGRLQISFSTTGDMTNGLGILHGGFAYALGDTCFACTCSSLGVNAVTRHAEITYIAPGSADSVLQAIGSVRTRYGRNIIVDVSIADQSGAQIAEMRVLGVITSTSDWI